jgi:hypothetical protein
VPGPPGPSPGQVDLDAVTVRVGWGACLSRVCGRRVIGLSKPLSARAGMVSTVFIACLLKFSPMVRTVALSEDGMYYWHGSDIYVHVYARWVGFQFYAMMSP